jgi:16S rRNA (guanine966-N2)-methyltransferase
MARSRPTAPLARGQLRIIGGRWRGRRVAFAAVEGLRPTPDRVRETLFNWLAPVIEGSRCLDLFCGSGALGLEALSRGAAEVVFIDRSRVVTEQLGQSLQGLGAEGARLLTSDALEWIASAARGAWDIVFVDPPYRQGLADRCIAGIEASGLLARAARVYVETGADEDPPVVPAHWLLHRDRRAGQVAYRLYTTATD